MARCVVCDKVHENGRKPVEKYGKYFCCSVCLARYDKMTKSGKSPEQPNICKYC